jgi:germination protein M
MPPRKQKKTARKKPGKKKPGNKRRLVTVLVVLTAFCCGIVLYAKKEDRDFTRYVKLGKQFIEKLKNVRPSPSVQTWKATLYFGDEYSDLLIREYRTITSPEEAESKASALINELIKGPRAKGTQTLPDNTRLLSVRLSRDGLLVIDFSPELSTNHPGGTSSELITIYSVVNTLMTNVEGVEKIKILINGEKIDSLAGHIDCREPFVYSRIIVK